jgi:hypothetical protein
MSKLLQTARAMDDQNFVWRVTAAMLVKADYVINAPDGQSVEALELADWVLDNPMVPVPEMNALVAVNGTVADKVVVDNNGLVNTMGIADGDIQYVVDSKWETVAAKRYPVVV